MSEPGGQNALTANEGRPLTQAVLTRATAMFLTHLIVAVQNQNGTLAPPGCRSGPLF